MCVCDFCTHLGDLLEDVDVEAPAPRSRVRAVLHAMAAAVANVACVMPPERRRVVALIPAVG